ncbi:tetracycline resistance protein, tetM/tetO subfamily [Streptomyces daqingensis]|uniref:Tetracycline resistance protein, tetM/tetO subfamily n=1 Tax=Streptomyces daqingensis TaxID=1472640 RepID=A0ABQ2MI85_9ACTN|nr:TetM/TetW/TetO/TetS family tetracycline resistance ribosomal protection protein [Streptomyces daqingensis]GGO52339.1 tetracycline resistance protein, tetM/tetO subfamily [Streptomyces daqingensis]
MKTLNLGILAHVDAGKTSLTERLLHSAGVIDEVGSVDHGSTRTDTLALERRRGITIKSAVVSFVLDGDVTVNLIDTPGHPDFIAEVERVLDVLDGAVLVVSAVEGVQPETRILMRTLQRLRIPVLVFVNKIDRRGAQDGHVVRAVRERLTPAVLPMGAVRAPGTREACFVPYGERLWDGAGAESGREPAELLAENDEELLAAYVEDGAGLPRDRLREQLAAQSRQGLVHPLFFGSAITGAGVEALTAGIRGLLPSSPGDGEGPVSGTVFKVERGAGGRQFAYVRMYAGTVRVRDRLPFGGSGGRGGDGCGEDAGGNGSGGGSEGKVTEIEVFERGAAVRRASVTAGQIGRLSGLDGVRIGDAVGPERGNAGGARHFAPPTLETVVSPCRPQDRGRLHSALTELAEADPLIGLRQDGLRGEVSVSLYGEVQKEVVQATLADEYGVGVEFRESTTICVERPAGTGAAVETMKKEPNPFLATVGLRVDPAPEGSGVTYGLEVELGSMPYAFMRAVEETVRETLREGLHGWQVTDCTVTMTHSGYAPRQSHAHAVFDKSMSSTGADFRQLTPLVLIEALKRAGTTVHEPVHRFRLEIPAETFGTVLPVLSRLRAVPGVPAADGPAYLLEGEIPAANIHTLEQRLPALAGGEGVLECVFSHYRPVAGGAVPSRPRTDHDPLNRKEYLLRVVRRVAGA